MLYNTYNIHTLMAEAAMQGQPAHQEQFGVQCLAQGYFDMELGEAGFRTM